MLDFVQRMEEIRRRSETILRARKRRRKALLALCIPLAAALGLWTVLARPFGAAQSAPTQPEVQTLAVMEHENISLICSIARIDVTDGHQELTHGDTNRILEIWDLLTALQDQNKLFSYATAEDATNNLIDDSPEISETPPPVYRITLTLHEGGIREFLLTEEGLELPEEGKVYAITKEQRTQLLQLLGLEGKEDFQ